MSGCETVPPALKPGQTQLYREDLYCNEAKPQEEPYLTQDQFAESVYVKTVSKITLPEDYEDPTKPYKPPDLEAAEMLHSTKKCSGGTSHWKTEYSKMNSDDGEWAEFGQPYSVRSSQPPASLLTRGTVQSAYVEDFGEYGTDPRDKIPLIGAVGARRDIDKGTTKGLRYIPGYQGFLPVAPYTEEVMRYQAAEACRSVDKTNIEQTFHSNVIGYSGHEPTSAHNCQGGARQSTKRTTSGHDFCAMGQNFVPPWETSP